MNREAFHARPVQLVSQVCGVLHAPVGDVKLTDPGVTEGDRDGGGGSPGTEEQNALAREFYAGLLAGHHHPAPVRIETAHPGIFDHHGVDGARDAGASSSSSSTSGIMARLCGIVTLKPPEL